MAILQALLYLLVGAAGTAVVLTRRPRNQILVLCFYGLLLTLLFAVLQAPDVALSQIAVGAAAIPLMLIVTLAEIRRHRPPEKKQADENPGAEPGVTHEES